MRLKTVKNIILLGCILITSAAISQVETSKWKVQFTLGVNNPSSNGFVENFEAKTINFPTIHLGVQHMFKPNFGAKLDFGYSRFSNLDNTPEFKVNYTRINAQFVADINHLLLLLPNQYSIVAHAGPGFTFVKPLHNYGDNKTSFFNVITGVELHRAITPRLSIFTDVSYTYGLAKTFNPTTSGFGSFNGNLMTITFGASISLSGCQYC